MHDLRPALGARIRELRRGLGLSQEDLADRAGLHWTYLSDLERGRQTPTMDVVNRLARAFGVTVAKFLHPSISPTAFGIASFGGTPPPPAADHDGPHIWR